MTQKERDKLEEELFDLEEQLDIPSKHRYYNHKKSEEMESELWKCFGNFCAAIKNNLDKEACSVANKNKFLIFKGSTDLLFIHYYFDGEEEAHQYMKEYWRGHKYHLKPIEPLKK